MSLSSSLSERLDEIYLDPSNAASYEGIHPLYAEAKRRGVGASFKQIKQYLSTKQSYTKHRFRRIRFPRNPIWVYSIHDVWAADLHFVGQLAWHNKRTRFLLVVVDSLSRMLYCEPLPNKNADTVLDGFKKIVERVGTTPSRFCSDLGTEFTNFKFREYLEANGVRFQAARPPLKSPLAEMTGRLLKNKIYKYLTENNTKCYLDKLQDFVLSLNSRTLKSLGDRAPKDVNIGNQNDVYFAQIGRYRKKKPEPFKYEIGANVRLSIKPTAFSKGYYTTFTDEIYTVTARVAKYPRNLYKLSDRLNNPINGRYYSEELLKIGENVLPNGRL